MTFPRAAMAGACALFLQGCQERQVQRQPMAGADADRGRRVIQTAACGACHDVPGVAWPKGRVGPALGGFADRTLIAGRFANEPETLARWIRDAPSLAPKTAMPAMPLTEQEARDAAAYLHTLSAG